MNIDKLFSDKEYLEREITFFKLKKHLRKISSNPELVQSHLKKARHNLEFYKLNKNQHTFNDWLIVTLYETIADYENKVLDFINKVEEMMQQ